MTKAQRLQAAEAADRRDRHLSQQLLAENHRMHALNCPICQGFHRRLRDEGRERWVKAPSSPEAPGRTPSLFD